MTPVLALFSLESFKVCLAMVRVVRAHIFWYTDRRKCAKSLQQKNQSLPFLIIGKISL